jgi:hypothetical protein
MEGASYQEKVERTPGDKFPEADTRQKDHDKNTHHAQHEKVRESEELGGHTDEAQAEAAAKSAAYFEFRKGAKEAQEKGPDNPEALKKADWANKQGGYTDTTAPDVQER